MKKAQVIEDNSDGYFEKPIDPLTIMEKIREILRGRADENSDS